ncbi:odorant receptor 85b-like isoform X2 [Athalia rosae]|uniref:odorant receptor 85b-like isoform X2 n=1 Tax=Athalia rosae TaxID=37344 RepID=UPI002033BFA9|nr:odorant receptor 85b-like isoform X2 [Athalia rosae]
MTSAQSTCGDRTPDPELIREAKKTYEKYIKWQRFLLRYAGLWPKQSHWSKLTCWLYDIYAFTLVLYFFYLNTTLYYTVREVWGDLFDVIEACSGVLSSVLMVQKACKVLSNREKIREINDIMRELWIDGWCKHEKVIRCLMLKSSFTVKIVSAIYMIPFILTVVAYPLAPYTSLIAQRKANVSEEELMYFLPYMIQIPWLDMSNSITYGIAYAIAATGGFLPIFWIGGIDTIFVAYLSQTCLQLDLLAVEFKDTVNGKETMNLRDSNHVEYSKKQKLRLYQCIEKHKTIIRIGELMEEVFSQMMLGMWVISTISMCAIMFQGVMATKHGNRIQFISFYLSEMGQVFMFCWIGEALIEKSCSLSQEIYSSMWYNVGKTVSKDLIFIMRRAQRPICITAGGFANVSMELYTTIWNTTISYFALLRELHSAT